MNSRPSLARRLRDTDADAADLIPIYSGITTAARLISAALRRGELGVAIGETGTVNVQGEAVKKLDALANQAFLDAYSAISDHALAGVVSEEMDEPRILNPAGHYFLMVDPLDGSSNIDNNITVGAIFSLVPHPRPGRAPETADFLRPGRTQAAAGYVMFGAATLLVTAASAGVDVFTLDENDSEFHLTRGDLKMPQGTIYSMNDSASRRWSPEMQKTATALRSGELLGENSNARYVGSLIADAHRTLLKGGCFFYPGEVKKPQGKLRLLYEACPMARLFEKAGGAASDGQRPILDIQPTDIHQRTPLLLGDAAAVQAVEQALRG